MSTRNENWYGRNWCRPTTRLAIYLRDGLACAWCGKGIEEGAALSLDHFRPVERGGDNDPGNLLTACLTCNSRRGAKRAAAFARYLVRHALTEESEQAVVRRISRLRRRRLPREQARELLRARTLTEVLSGEEPDGDFRCEAVQHADQTACERCGLVWDTNDPDPPACHNPGTAREAV